MIAVFRFIAAVIAGMLIAFLLVVGIEMLSAIVHPFPADFGGTMEEVCQHVARYPHWILALAALAWGITALLSTWSAEKIGGRMPALVVGILLVAAVVFNISSLPYPIWFKIVSVVLVSIAGVLGSRLLLRRRSSHGPD